MFWYGASKWLLSDSKPILLAEAKFNELLHPVVSTPRSGSNSENGNQHTWSTVSSNSHTRLPVISLPIFSGNTCDWPHSRRHFNHLYDVHRSNAQRVNNLISTLQGEEKAPIENLPVTNENFTVAGQLINQIYHPCQLCQFPLVTRDSASNLTSLNNHINTHKNALQVLPMSISLQHLLIDNNSSGMTGRTWRGNTIQLLH
jgi:hypothetical protein